MGIITSSICVLNAKINNSTAINDCSRYYYNVWRYTTVINTLL